MKYTFYGTAAGEGIPGFFCECATCKRAKELGGKNIMTRSQSVIDDTLGIDFSADAFMHMINYGYPSTKVSSYLITHGHDDHFYPREFATYIGWYSQVPDDKSLDIYMTQYAYDLMKKAFNTQPYEKLHLHLVEAFATFTTKEGYKVTPLKADHTADPVFYVIEKDKKTVLHANDTGYFPKETWDWLEENKPYFDFAEFDTTIACCNPDIDEHTNHMNFSTVEKVRKKLTDMGCLDDKSICVINHFTHNAGMLYDDLKKWGDEHGYLTSYDTMSVEF